MATDTVGHVGDPFLCVPCPNLSRLVLMASIAREAAHVVRVARLARALSALTVVDGESRVCQGELGWRPAAGIVASSALCALGAERAGMERRLGMTARAIRRRAFEGVILVALVASE